MSPHFYSLYCMSYIQMILSLRSFMVSIPTIKDNMCFQLKPNVIVSVYSCCVHWDWGRQHALLSHCARHCEWHMWDHYGSSCWCTNGLHLLWGMQLYWFWCCRYCISHVVRYSKVDNIRGFFNSYLRFFARSVLAHFSQYTGSFSHCTGSF